MSAPDPPSYDVHVISHTHWDREWYLPLGRFRQRLVALIDELLALGVDTPRFLLDGQAIVLEDYLAVRPERAAELGAALRARRLEAGPWYVLADELIPGGEALVRNLLAGRRALRALRAEAPPVLYCPDSFGHPAALPMLAQGFGLEVAIVWRGYGGARWPAGDAARWRHGHASTVVLYHLPRSGYEFGANLPADVAAAAERWRQMRLELAPRARLGVLLVQNGADHHALQADHDAAVRALARVAESDRIVTGTLGEFAREISRRARETELPVVEGELRDSYGYAWTLQGTFGARAHQKRRNARVERTLVREAEPWSAIATLRGGASRRHLLHSAWRTLLQCHPHDTLCGCSIDEVARAMECRLEEAEAQARGIRTDALLDVVGHDPARARTQQDSWRPVLLVRNPAARPRAGVADVEISIPLRHVPVGPGSGAGTSGVGVEVSDAWANGDDVEASEIDASTGGDERAASLEGGKVPLQILQRTLVDQRVESPRHYPRNELVARITALAWVPTVAGYGTMALSIDRRAVAESTVDDPVVVTGTTIDNGLLRIECDANGVRLFDRAGGRVIESLIALEDVGDAGDLYTHSPASTAIRPPMLESVRSIDQGPLRGTVEMRWRVPVSPARPRTPERRTRSRRGPVIVAVRLSLDAAARFVRVAVRGENGATDHRLRLRIRTDVPTGDVWADAAFGPVRRVALDASSIDTTMETPPRTAPLHRYVTRADDVRGATIFADGLAEYEACADGSVAITLVRAVGALSRNDLPERPGHAGWPTPTPGAQCLGPFAGRFALLTHGPRDAATIDRIERTADDVLLPLTGSTLRSATSMPEPTHGIELVGEGLAFSSAKESEDGEWLVLRCVNLLDQTVDGVWRVGVRLREARLARLDETPGEAIEVSGDRIAFRVEGRGTSTVIVRGA